MNSETTVSVKNFNCLSDRALHEETLLAAKTEKQATLALLEYLSEIDSRRLYSARGYSSLWEYVHKYLGYSESQASERVSAMRLMKKVPEVREKLAAQAITLTTTAKLASFVKREACSPEKTLDLLERVTDKPTREAEKILLSEQKVPDSKPDTLKLSSPEITRISFDADSEFMGLLEELKSLQGHPEWTMNDRLKTALRIVVTEKNKNRSAPVLRAAEVKPVTQERAVRVSNKHTLITKNAYGSSSGISNLNPLNSDSLNSDPLNSDPLNPNTPSENPHHRSPPTRSRYIPVSVRRATFKRSQGQCEYVDPITKRRCESRSGLQLDHRKPFAKGGTSTADNIRHLCPNHNRFMAVRHFGRAKMERYGFE